MGAVCRPGYISIRGSAIARTSAKLSEPPCAVTAVRFVRRRRDAVRRDAVVVGGRAGFWRRESSWAEGGGRGLRVREAGTCRGQRTTTARRDESPAGPHDRQRLRTFGARETARCRGPTSGMRRVARAGIHACPLKCLPQHGFCQSCWCGTLWFCEESPTAFACLTPGQNPPQLCRPTPNSQSA